MNLRRLISASAIAAALLGSVAMPSRPAAAADSPALQPTYTGDCAHLPAGSTCIEFADGYIWLVEDTITGWGSNHGTVQIAYGTTADYGHAFGTSMVWTLSK